MRWDRHVASMGKRRGAKRFFGGKREGQRPLGRTKRRWENNINYILQKCDGAAWSGLIWLRIGTNGERCECVNEPSGSIKCGRGIS